MPRCAIFSLALLIAMSGAAGAQTPASEWNVGIYPVLYWGASGVDIDWHLPPEAGGDLGLIVESRLDGAGLRRVLRLEKVVPYRRGHGLGCRGR